MAITIENLSLAQLQDREVINKILEATQDYIGYRKTHEARELSNQLEKRVEETNLEQINSKIYSEYKSIIAKLKFVAINYLLEEEMLDLVKTGFLDGLKEEEINVEEGIKTYLLGITAITNWDNSRRKIIAALRENKQKLGTKTIQEWLDDYVRTLGARIHTDMERSNYVGKLALPPAEGRLLLNLFKFYDSIKITVPIPRIGVSEESLRDYFGELGYPLSKQGEQVLIDYLKMGRGLPPKEKLIPPLRESVGILARKPSELVRPQPPLPSPVLPQKPTPPSPPLPPKIEEVPEKTPEEISAVYEGKISPYEKEREITPTKPIEEKIPTFPKEIEIPPTKPEPKPMPESKPRPEPPKPEPLRDYQIRTMKQDIEKAKKQPMPTGRQAIPPRPKPKIKDNIVDLSGKE